jgi:glycosyltransferase involved in cell wall biosynthesis
MRVLLVNKFFFLKGGSEASFFNTASILKKNGHIVSFFSMDHPENRQSPYAKHFVSHVDYEGPRSLSKTLKASLQILYSREARTKLERLLDEERPDVVHLHNIHHQISPSILFTLKKYDLPVIMTLHDYKMVCPVYTLISKGQICERCKNKNFYHCTVLRCSKNSLAKSLLNTLEMYLHHSLMHVYDSVDTFISPSLFLKTKLEDMGFKKRIVHLPHFIDSDRFAPSYSWENPSLVYFGRLSKEKGIFTLLQAIKGLSVECRIYGDGPEKKNIIQWIADKNLTNVQLCGHVSQERLKTEIQKAMFVVLPSEWYENSPFSVHESFALGKPVIGSRIGGIPEIVQDEKNGLTFEPGNAEDLRKNILYLLSNSERIRGLGENARCHVEKNYSPEKYYETLIKIYAEATENKK